MNIKNVFGDKLIVIQFPNSNLGYNDYLQFYSEINYLPIPEESYLYREYDLNNHHFTTDYHIKTVIPFILKETGQEFNINDFDIEEKYHEENGKRFDLSHLKPKQEEKYKVKNYINGEEHIFSFNEVCCFDWDKSLKDCTDYHSLYRYYHQCSSIHNDESVSDKKIFISGDSQMIPSIVPLAHYFRDLYYFDNRTGMRDGILHDELVKDFINERLDVDFILISVWEYPNKWYNDVNFR